jgi:hypothetical protein
MNFRDWSLVVINNNEYESLERLYEILGSNLGVKAGSVKQWALGQRRVSAEHVISLERLTEGRVTRHSIRRDLYPD